MKVKSYNTNRAWLETQPATPQEQSDTASTRSDPAGDELFRLLSEAVRMKNLVVLTGLGTSLCVKDGDDIRAPTMQDLWDAIRVTCENGSNAEQWDHVLRIARHPNDSSDIEELLSRCKISESFVDGDDRTTISDFIRQAEDKIRTMVDFVDPDDRLLTHESFLRRLARRSVRRDRLKVFTTNYDLCFEHAAQSTGFTVVDGFSFSRPSTFDPLNFAYDIVRRSDHAETPDYIENLFHLHKIHGSIDWARDLRSGRVIKSPSTDRPLLIYPRHTKYELAFAQPYLEMISSFQSSIRQKDTGLLVVGFGFNDSHITEPILAAVETNLSMKLVVVSPTVEVECGSNHCLSRLSSMIDQGDARLGLVNATFEEVVPTIPDVTAMTDLERHIARMRAIQEE